MQTTLEIFMKKVVLHKELKSDEFVHGDPKLTEELLDMIFLPIDRKEQGIHQIFQVLGETCLEIYQITFHSLLFFSLTSSSFEFPLNFSFLLLSQLLSNFIYLKPYILSFEEAKKDLNEMKIA